MGILEGSRILITGVLTDTSLAYGVAELAQREGAEVILTGFGRGMSITQRTARKLPTPPEVLELDVSNPEHLENLTQELQKRWDSIDGVLHSIGFAPESALGGNFMNTDWEDVAVAMQISAFSYKALAAAAYPLMKERGGSIIGLTFDARVAWPVYDWMGVAKAALESTSRYLARDLGKDGIRVNMIAAGPLSTMAARSIPGFEMFERWSERAPLGWDTNNSEAVAKAAVALFSDWFPATTGEMIHVDGGYHAMGV